MEDSYHILFKADLYNNVRRMLCHCVLSDWSCILLLNISFSVSLFVCAECYIAQNFAYLNKYFAMMMPLDWCPSQQVRLEFFTICDPNSFLVLSYCVADYFYQIQNHSTVIY